MNQGKKNRAKGRRFEDKVYADLMSRNHYVSRWSNNVDSGKLIKAKYSPYNRFTGFPDFIVFNDHMVFGVECKFNRYITKEEKAKIDCLLINRIFRYILIAFNVKRTVKYDAYYLLDKEVHLQKDYII